MARHEISLQVRFRTLRRDHFTCMYCGGRPPYVRLHVDHVVAVSRGGQNDEKNLITACSDCNLGKSDLEFVHPRPDGARYKPMAECLCPRLTCGGPKNGRDAVELECMCRGCHDCDICGNDYCDRVKYSGPRLLELAAENDPLGCTQIEWSFDAARDLLKKYPGCDVVATCSDPKWVPLYGIRPDVQVWLRKAIAGALGAIQKSDAAEGAQN